MPENKIRIEVPGIEGIKLSTKTKIVDQVIEKVVVVSFECKMQPKNLARIYNLDRQGAPMNVIIESPQAQFDLKVEQLELKTGEIVSY